MTTGFRLPGGDKRIAVIGRTGSGKTTLAAWLLSRARLDIRPWVIIDFKGEDLFDAAGEAISDLKFGKDIPDKGIWRVFSNPGDEARVEALCWSIHRRGNVGLFVDECMNMPRQSLAFSSILRQGRSKRIPVIACTQRPSFCQVEVFSEADFFAVFRLSHPRDRDTVRGFAPVDWKQKLPKHSCWYYDVAEDHMMVLPPVSDPDTIPARIRQRAPEAGFRWFT